MMASLQGLSLKCLVDHLPILPGDVVRERLPTRLKEVVLQTLSEREMITKEYVPVINKCLFVPELKDVKLYMRPEATDEVIECLAETPCKLRSLRIGNINCFHHCKIFTVCSRVKRETLMTRLLEKQSDLEILEIHFIDMRSCDFLTKVKNPNLKEFMFATNKIMILESSFVKGMESVARNNVGLESINIRWSEVQGRWGVNNVHQRIKVEEKWNKAIINIAKYIGSHLKTFVVDGKARSFSDEAFHSIGKHCQNLTTLILKYYNVWISEPTKSYDVTHLFKENCKELQSVVILPTLFDQNTQPQICEFPVSLTTFKLMPQSTALQVTQEPFKLPDFPLSLQELCIPMLCFKIESLEAIFTQLGPRLKVLDFPCPGFQEPSYDLEHSVITCIVDHCVSLTSLGLCCTDESTLNILLEMFRDKHRSKKIYRLQLMSSAIVYPIGVSNPHSHIRDFENVKTILGEIVESCTQLREFTTNNNYIDNRLLISISLSCPHFNKLQIDKAFGAHPDSGHFTLPAHETINDDGLSELAIKCPLEELHLLGKPFTELTSNGLSVLKSCPYLQVLTIFHCDEDSDTLESTLNMIHKSALKSVKIHQLSITSGPKCSCF
ncbi:uncharacterized protein LOC144436606 [Glandiceps talaboti]